MVFFRMRKYHQLLLIIVSIVSLFTVLVYRREYLKLRYILEVINFFGSPQAGLGDCIVLNETLIDSKKEKHLFSDPSTSWIKIDQHYVYSAFWETEGDKAHIRAIAVGPSSAFTDFDCHIWYDQGDTLSSVNGKFGYSVTYTPKNKTHHKIKIYQLYCEPVIVATTGSPYGMVFIYKKDNQRLKTFIPVYSKRSLEEYDLKMSAICVKPDVSGISKSSIIEFLSYHKAIGVSEFIVYDNGLQYAIIMTLQSLGGVKGVSRISKLQWNFPYNDIELENTVLEVDCIARTSGKVGTVAVLDWDQYIVPRHHHSLNEMLAEHAFSSKIYSQFELQSTICCTDLKDDKRAEKSWATALRKTQCMPLGDMKSLVVQYPRVGYEPTKQKLPPSVGAIHTYRPCTNLRTITKYDPIMARYLGDFMTSTLLRLWQSGALLSRRQSIMALL
uniref:Glycosyltransferase family 92 protein n=1 Tax=Clastoptera arizonana TaxID=38151 RepID=A0A1B6CFK3_9HEMI